MVADYTQRKEEKEQRKRLVEELREERRRSDRYAGRLLESNSALRALIETIPAAVVTCDEHGTFTLANSEARLALRNNLGGSAWGPVDGRRVILRPDGSPMPPDELPMPQALKHGRATRNVEFVIRYEDGSEATYQASASPLRDKEGHVVGAVAAMTDVTAHRELEATLRQTKEFIEAIVRASPLAILAVDLDWKVLFWSRSAEELFGWPAGDVLGQAVPIVPPDALEEFRRVLDRVRDGETVSYLPVTRKTRDGQPIDLYLWAAPVRKRDDGEQVAGAMVMYALRETG